MRVCKENKREYRKTYSLQLTEGGKYGGIRIHYILQQRRPTRHRPACTYGTQRPQEKFSHAQQNASEAQIFHQHCSFASALLTFLSPTLPLSLRAQ